MRAIFFAASAACLAIGVGALRAAETPAPDIIITRRAGFDLQDAVMDGFKRSVAAKADPKPLADGADAIAAWTQQIPTMFPTGTETGHDTMAKSTIWSDRPGFEAAAAKASDAAEKLAQLAKAGDVDGVADQFGELGRDCNACHRGYRNRK